METSHIHTLENSFIQQAELTHPICFTRHQAEGLTSHTLTHHVIHTSQNSCTASVLKLRWGSLAGISPPGPVSESLTHHRGPRDALSNALTVNCTHAHDNEFIYKGAEDAWEEREEKRDALGLFWQRSSLDRWQAGERVQRERGLVTCHERFPAFPGQS